MAYVTSIADRVPSGRGISFSRTIVLVIAAFALASGAAVWIGDFDSVAWFSDSASPNAIDPSSFDDRFSVGPAPNCLSTDIPPRSLVRSLPSELEIKFQQAKGRLAQKLKSQDTRVALFEEPSTKEPAAKEPTVEEPPPSSVAAVPLPRSRPVEANPEWEARPPAAQPPAPSRSDDRTLLQKLSDLLPARMTLASLASDG